MAIGSIASGMLAGAFNAPPLQQRSSAVPKFPEGQTASVRDWSQNPAVAAAIKTGNVSEIEKATIAARDAFRAGGTWADMSRQVPLNPTPALQQRTPEQQQDLLAQMRERGEAIRQRLDQESIQRGYAFRQGLAETEAQRAFGSRFGPDYNRAAQASTEAERWKQAQTGRSPFSQEPLNVRGMQVRGVGMGQFAPVRDFGSEWQKNIFGGGPQPASRTAITPNTTNLSKAFGEFEPFSLWRGPEIRS